jgi:glycosyltransferase involved in cell wall biosynthesis
MNKQDKDPVVSVVIPNFNYARYLKRRLESVFSQTFQDIEVIFIDDASTDNSLDVIENFRKEPRLRIITNDTNSGNLFKNWNSGVALARGQYIWIAEADDYADKRFLELLINELRQDDRIGIAYCQSLKVDDADRIRGSMLEYTSDLDRSRWKHNYRNDGQSECLQYLIFKNTIPNASAVLFRKDVYVKSGCALESVYYGNDWLTWVSMLLNSNIAFLAEPLNYYREHHQSVRRQMDMTETEAGASLMVLDYINRELKPEKRLLKRALNNWMKNWVNMIFRGKGKMNNAANFRLLSRVKRIDPMAECRWMKEMQIFPLNLIRKKLALLSGRVRKSHEDNNGIEKGG